MKSLAVSGLALALVLALAPAAAAGEFTSCKLRYTLKGWSFIYKQSKGAGTVTCDNGQTAKVTIETHGGGLTAGKSEIDDGKGVFSEVKDISEVFGTYIAAEASAGATKSAGSQAMTKGEISLALSGTGRGVDLGIAFGSFTITRQ
jgi:hypothetical protein